MTDRLTIHYPIQVPIRNIEDLVRQIRYDLLTIQNSSQRIFDDLADLSFLNKPLIIKDAYVGADTLIEHKLGREVVGYIVIKNNTVGAVVTDEIDTTTEDLALNLPLRANLGTTVDLIVF